jgi:taurine dioxygenase
MALQIKPTSAPVGAYVTGLDIDNLSPADQDELYAAWLRHGVLIFKGCVSSGEQHIRLTEVFGETELHPVEHLRLPDEPRIIELAANGGQPVAADDPTADQLVGVIPWHSDLSYIEIPTRGALLRAMIIPEKGGNTGWIDTIGLYKRLPIEVRTRLQGLRITHSYRTAHMAQSMVKGSADLFPDCSLPLVSVHPENDQPVLNISPSSAKEITGLPEDEAQKLLDYLKEFSCREEHAYIHKWEPGDVVLWDNWRTLHSALGHLKRYPRKMHRTTLRSTMKLGEWLVYDENGEVSQEELARRERLAAEMA